MVKKCKICGKFFNSDKYNKTVCGDLKCKNLNIKKTLEKSRNNPNKKIASVINCIECGKEFKQTHGGHLTCSKECAEVRRLKIDKIRYKTTDKEKTLQQRKKYQEKNKDKIKILQRKRYEKEQILRQSQIRICIVCGNSFTYVNGVSYGTKLCSEECFKVRRLQQTKKWQKENRERYLELRNKTIKKCAEKNKEKNCMKKYNVPRLIGNCTICGKEFVKKTINSITCSKSCSRENTKNKQKEHNYSFLNNEKRKKIVQSTIRNCIYCGKEFYYIRGISCGIKFCSETCRDQKHSQYMQQWRIENKNNPQEYKEKMRTCKCCGEIFQYIKGSNSGTKLCSEKCASQMRRNKK